MQRVTPVRWVELRALEAGTWFRFVAFPDQVAQLVEKGPGRALIRYTRRDPETRTFEARARNGQKVTRTVTVKQAELEPCALGAQVVPIDAGPLQRIIQALEPIASGEVLDGLRGIDAGYRELQGAPR